MMLLSLGRRRGDAPDQTDTTPYQLPTARPYNAPVSAITPTPDGSGQATHPSVLDFGTAGWRGWRYWMAVTPYKFSNVELENPNILHSQDGFTWSVPAGLTNPIAPWPGVAGDYNSDTELVHDPSTDTLICYWREVINDAQCIIWAKSSTDGINWSTAVEVIPSSPVLEVISQSVVRRGPGDWWMFYINRTVNPFVFTVRQSVNPLTGWGAPVNKSLPDPLSIWHMGALWDGSAFRVMTCEYDGGPMRCWSSTDGTSWSVSGPIMEGTAGWDSGMYRPSFQIKDSTYMRVWYSAFKTVYWFVGYTQVPRSEWPTPPA